MYTKNALSFRCTLVILHLPRMCRNVNRKVYNDRKKCKHCRALSVCILVLIFVGSSHRAHYKFWNLCYTFTPRLLDAYRLRKKRHIPAFCLTYSHLSYDKFLCQNVGLEVLQSMGVDRWGTREHVPHLSAWGGEHRKCPPTFPVYKNKFTGI